MKSAKQIMNTLKPSISDYVNLTPHPSRVTGGKGRGSKNDITDRMPIVTIFSIVLNAAEDFERTIRSVLRQSYCNIEYIVVDGGSTDSTLDVLKEYTESISLWISEPDNGTSDAANKAISLATGKYIFWIGAGDVIQDNYISVAVNTLEQSGADFVFGRIKYSSNGCTHYESLGDPHYLRKNTYFPKVNYATWVMKRECFEKIGLLDLSYTMINDFEWGLRLRRCGGWGYYEGLLELVFQQGGKSSENFLVIEAETFRALNEHGVPRFTALYFIFLRVVRSSLRMILETLSPTVYSKLRSFLLRK